MKYVPLGRTGVKISAVGLGCGNFGGIGSAPELFGKGESESEAFALLDAAWDMGINYFDTANSYGGGRSETYVGNWLRTKGSRVRQKLLLSSKVFNRVGPGPNDAGLSRYHILAQIDQSLARLGTDHLDMYLLHEPDDTTPLEETLGTLDDLIRLGKVRYIGASNMPAWLVATALWICERNHYHRFEWIQNNYSLLYRRDEASMLPLCADAQLGYTPFSPLAGGWLTGKYRRGDAFPAGSRMTLRPNPYYGFINDRTFDALESLERLATERGTDMGSLALAWVMAHPQVTSPIVGPRNPAHLEPARHALELTLSADEHQNLSEIFTFN